MSPLTPEQQQQVKQIFHAALERPASARAAYLDEACAGDAALRAEIESLLATHQETGELQAYPTAEAVDTSFNETTELPGGQKLGDYEIQRMIGAGGMGEVYLARDLRLGRPVALKVLPAKLMREPDRVRRFQHEARAASALNHPNILTIYEVGQEHDLHFIATEYIEGQTLRAVLKAGGLTVGEVLDAITQVGKALEVAHKAGIIHRDIKPENLMRRADGYVKVLDFGLAKLTESQSHPSSTGEAYSHFTTRPGVVMGTVTYMSPEQARGYEVDARSDIFSLGVVLYEMLTGRVPFDGRTASDVVAALLEREPQPLESFISGLPQQFQHIIARALAKPVEERYATMAEMLGDLHRLKQDLELASNLKKYGKTKSAEQSLLDLRVGDARSRGEMAHRATRGSAGRGASVLDRTGQWVKTHRGLALASLLGLVAVLAIFSQWYGNKWKFEFGDASAIDSIAVMPFADEVKDPQLNYVPDGLTESLIHSLANLPRLRVMASGSVFTYKGRAINPLQIGKELNVSAIVSGRVQKRGEQLLISVELADTRDGARLWGAQYERPLAQLLLVQAEIVRELTQQMRLRLSGTQQQQLARHQPANNEAYQNYLKGRFLFEFAQPTRETLEKALDYFQQAIAADPTYALAYTGMADLYVTFASQQLSPVEAMAKAKAAAQRASELDPTLAEAHNSMAGIHWLAEWDFPAAEAEFKRALELNPNAAAAATDYSQFLLHMKRLDEAQRMAARSQTLNPLSPHGSLMMAYALAGQHRYDAAIEQCRKTLELNPQDLFAHSLMSQFQAAQGQFEAAQSTLQRGLALNRHNSLLSVLGYLQGRQGKQAEARQLAAELEQQSHKRYVSPVQLARIYVGLNDHDRALAWLRRGYEQHSDHMLWIGVEQIFDPLRNDPRFLELMKQVGLPH